MGWEDRPYYRDHGYSSSRLRAFFAGSVPLFCIRGLWVRIHNATVVFLLSELLLSPRWLEISDRFLILFSILILSLARELSRAATAWLTGGVSSEITLWPLGGLTFPETGPRPAARVATILAAPIATAAICVLSAGAVWFFDRHTLVSLNPAHLIPSPVEGPAPAGMGLTYFFWWLFSVGSILLVINTLPIFPLDGGHMLQTMLWRFAGAERSRIVTCLVGMFGSVLLFVVGLALLNWATLGILFLSAWLFITCYQERMMLLDSGPREPWQTDEHDFASSLYREEKLPRRRVSKRLIRLARKRARQDALDRQRLDAILAKVSATGIASLRWRERRVLKAATATRRKQEEELKSFLQD